MDKDTDKDTDTDTDTDTNTDTCISKTVILKLIFYGGLVIIFTCLIIFA
jgi:hypothetical protein